MNRLTLAALLVACRPTAPAQPDAAPPVEPPAPAPVEAPAPAPAPVADVGADPALNEAYMNPAQTRRWNRRFTEEGREVAARRSDVLKSMSLRPGMDVADVGAGTGLYTLELARAVGPKGQVYAVDVVPHFLRHIEAAAQRAGLTNVRLVQASDASPGLPPASVDLVFVCDAYHHFERPAAQLAGLKRALRPGGELWLVDIENEPGRTPAWVANHVRAGKATVLAELAAAGFELVEDRTAALGMRDNYVLRLRARVVPSTAAHDVPRP